MFYFKKKGKIIGNQYKKFKNSKILFKLKHLACKEKIKKKNSEITEK